MDNLPRILNYVAIGLTALPDCVRGRHADNDQHR